MTAVAGFIQAQKSAIEEKNSLPVKLASGQTQAIQALVSTRLQATQDKQAVLQIFTTIQLAKQKIGQLEQRITKIQSQNLNGVTTVTPKPKEPDSKAYHERLANEDVSRLLEQRKEVGKLHDEISQKRTEINAALKTFDRMLPGEQDLIDRMNATALEISKKQGAVVRLTRELYGTVEEINGEKLMLREVDFEISSEEASEMDVQLKTALVRSQSELRELKDEFSEIEERLREYQKTRDDFKETARQIEIALPIVKEEPVEGGSGPSSSVEESDGSDDAFVDAAITQKRFVL